MNSNVSDNNSNSNDSTLHNIKEEIKYSAHELKESVKDVAHNIAKAVDNNHLYQNGGHLSQKTTVVENVESVGPTTV